MPVISLLLLLEEEEEEEEEESWSSLLFLERSFNHRDIEGMPAMWRGVDCGGMVL
jgi:hypothetical protein